MAEINKYSRKAFFKERNEKMLNDHARLTARKMKPGEIDKELAIKYDLGSPKSVSRIVKDNKLQINTK